MSGFVPFRAVKARSKDAGAETIVNLARVLVIAADPQVNVTMLELGDSQFIAVEAAAEDVVQAATRGGLDFLACLGVRASRPAALAIRLSAVREIIREPGGRLRVYMPGRFEELLAMPEGLTAALGRPAAPPSAQRRAS